MALIQCRVCGQMISDRAKNCPKCGTPTHADVPIPKYYVVPYEEEVKPKPEYYQQETNDSHKLLYVIIAFLIALIICVVYYLFSGKGGDNSVSGGASAGSNLTVTANGVSFTMVFVKGGTYTMGATPEQGRDAFDCEKPAHSETVGDFWIGETEVTQALWKAVMGSNPSYFKGSNRPVEQVSWNDCQTFVNKLNSLLSGQLPAGHKFRLPTEAEWEYAARGGNRSGHYKYSGSNNLGSVAWYEDNSGITTHDVKTKNSNELGIYDMSGNVWEWCHDNSRDNYNASYKGSFRVGRGGSWVHDAGGCRVSYRFDCNPSSSYYSIGLRVALYFLF